ncbi:hypothetical protein P168DRAFT_177493 [Aspergillus campestris IBT 28561]|uniref:Aminotransferase class I/classII large domain-containing protein n=1 Tax=Aspergillus campestris (strain IBT 28561) TaxID=1392248 RepID=A0A2I1CZQ8_ASPC2|nr:uncharacterized protein P168DRAFT_177493 [Aspergillus campestris IBT 28561]PKY03117.1 hypothetical protein P168DRAFT_177493 [Aspergillus campestris IBT 28561]
MLSLHLPVPRSHPGARIVATNIPGGGRFIALWGEWRVRVIKEPINCATFNYSALPDMNGGSLAPMEDVLRQLPLTLGENDRLESRATAACATYMGYTGCVFTGSGFTADLLAFAKIASWALQTHGTCIILYDDCAHGSLQASAIQAARVGATEGDHAGGVSVMKFMHNDMDHLRYMLGRCPKKAQVCVAIEGLYSADGSIPPIPNILELKEYYNFLLLVNESHGFLSFGSGGRGCFEYWRDLGYDCPTGEVAIMTTSLAGNG